ncbi:MAG TPA: glycosyltransferase [Pyrinomonadaceae bacterium]|jgi:glycosyltransferase involved in cell wall biosynthesis
MSIRVFHVITSLGRGGAERQLVNLVSNTNGSEFEHIVCYLREPAPFAEEIERGGHKVIGLDLSPRWPWMRAPARLIRLLKEHGPDIIQTWLYDADVGSRLTHLGRTKIPIINTLHLTAYEPETIRAANWSRAKVSGLRLIDKLSASLARPLFVACSHTVMESAKKNLGIPASRIQVIYNSIDLETLRTEPGEPARLRRELGIPETGFVYLNVARLDPQKGQAYLLQAFERVLQRVPQAYLALVGDGMLAGELRQLAGELGISERVLFLGRRSDVGACLEMADVFVFPSFFEGLPLAPIEAMIKGLPCIASRIGPHVEVIADEEAGTLITPGSVDELTAAMERLYGDAARRRAMAARGQQSALRRFSNLIVMPQWENLYREVVPHAGRTGGALAGR